MHPNLIVSVSGIRGIVGESLTPESACRFGAALGSWLGGKSVVVARDSRPSGLMLRHAVYSGLLAAGCRIEDIGIAATPTVGIAVRHLKAAGAIQITASHNPAPWNGLKLFGGDGAVLPAKAGAEIKALFESGDFALKAWGSIGSAGAPPDVGDLHLQMVLDQVSVASIAASRIRVFLDGNGGAGGPLGVRLLDALGCEVVQHHCESDGVFAHEPEPTPAHLVDVAPWVKQSGSAIGCVLDPDSDRLALIDETGNCLSEELTLALAVKYALRSRKGAVAVNMSTSRVIEDIARAAGCEFYRSAVGEANVVESLRANNAVIGGEGNGGVIDPRIGWVRDPFIGMALILNLMADEGKPLSVLASELPQYCIVKQKYGIEKEKLPAAYAALKAKWPQARVSEIDGLRLDLPEGWLHVRSSNTEPVVRVIAEAASEPAALALCQQAGELLE